MINLWDEEKLVVKRLRVKSLTTNPQALRWRMSDSLNRISLEPTGLPRSAILCIRSLPDTRTDFTSSQRNDVQSLSAWERLVTTSINDLARRAAHPVDGPVPASAPAVLFLNPAELLACLSADWCSGELHSNWWWKGLLSEGDIAHAVINAWLITAQYIPSALECLEAKHLAVSFLSKLHDQHVRQLINKLVETYGLYELGSLEISSNIHRFRRSALEKLAFLQAHQNRHPSMGMHAPWYAWISGGHLQLSPDREFVLGVGLSLQRTPSVVRTIEFAEQVKAWLASINHVPQAEPNNSPRKQTVKTDEIAKIVDEGALSEQHISSPSPTTLALEGFDTLPTPFSHDTRDSSTEIGPLSSFDVSTDRAQNADEFWSGADLVELEVQTQFGGICYFINLGLYLEFYSDFTTPKQQGIDLPIWDFVALLAREIVGEQVLQDPIWLALARLAGRAEDEAPGLDFHPAGSDSLQSWLDEWMLTIKPRLQSALGVEHEDLESFFHQDARVVVTATDFDVYFALAALPIEIRLSGLDRDPGWVPAAGKFIRFYYE